MAKTYYEILQVLPDASPEVIRAAYKSLSAKYHPDRDASIEAKVLFAQVQKAFDTLSDEGRRSRYDSQLQNQPLTNTALNDVIMRVDGTSSHLTLVEHLRRGGRELAECDLSGLMLDGASFRGANLTKAKLDGSSFIGCDFRQSNLTDTSALNCKFPGVWFGGATILRANFTGSALRGAAFFGANAIWASTCKTPADRFLESHDPDRRVHDKSVATGVTRIEISDFSGCDLHEAQFAAAPNQDRVSNSQESIAAVFKFERVEHFRQTYSDCKLINTTFSNANLQCSDFHGLALEGLRFDGAVLNGANLNGCSIEDVDLSSCSVTNVDLHHSKYSCVTKLPTGFRLPSNAQRLDPPEQPKPTRQPPADHTQSWPNYFRNLTFAILFTVVVAGVSALQKTRPARTETPLLLDPATAPNYPAAQLTTGSNTPLDQASIRSPSAPAAISQGSSPSVGDRMGIKKTKILPLFADKYYEDEKYSEAIAAFELQIRDLPPKGDMHALNRLAWILSTCPNGALRNGRRALELAEEASRRQQFTPYVNIENEAALAVAHGEIGDFQKAEEHGWKVKIKGNRGSWVDDMMAAFSKRQAYRVIKPSTFIP